MGIICCIWIYSFLLPLFPLLGACGKIGYDAVQGRCHIICPEARIILLVGDGLPMIILVVSYAIVYMKLQRAPRDDEARRKKINVLILTFCYIVFMLPHSIFEALPVDAIPNRAFFNVIFHAWFWCMFAINFFIYIIFWERVRKAMKLLMYDILEIVTMGWFIKWPKPKIEDDSEIPWWRDMVYLQ